MMFTEGAVIVGITVVNLPFMALTLQSVIESIDRSVEEAAFSLGAGPALTTTTVVAASPTAARARHVRHM